MRSRLIKLAATLAALTALAFGGSSLATAASKTTPSTPPAAEPQSGASDTDNIQQGDQTGSDQSGATDQTGPTGAHGPTGSDQADAQNEQADSESGPSDGPGGYTDTNPNADTQQEGEH